MAKLVYDFTEGNKDLPTDSVGLSDCFFATQLPLGSFPRMASDQRHPGGLNALFFDTHVERMAIKEMDAGWPNPIELRLRYFTTVQPAP